MFYRGVNRTSFVGVFVSSGNVVVPPARGECAPAVLFLWSFVRYSARSVYTEGFFSVLSCLTLGAMSFAVLSTGSSSFVPIVGLWVLSSIFGVLSVVDYVQFGTVFGRSFENIPPLLFTTVFASVSPFSGVGK